MDLSTRHSIDSIDSVLPLLAMYKTTEIVMINKMKITTAPSTVKEIRVKTDIILLLFYELIF